MHVRFERSDGILETMDDDTAKALTQWIVVGPYEWVQLTYRELRTAPDGDVLAYYTDDEGWFLRDEHIDARLHASIADRAAAFSDVVAYG